MKPRMIALFEMFLTDITCYVQSNNSRFSVLDEDSLGADFLGEYRLKLSIVRPDIKESYSVYLQNKADVCQ
jgi:hypothetical protein